MVNRRVFFDLSINDHPTGRIVMELFTDSTPLTVENFRALCTIVKGIATVGKPLHYKGSTFHHVIPGYMVHLEDLSHENGTRGGSSFADENFVKCPWQKPTRCLFVEDLLSTIDNIVGNK
ncbi:hypothetical protein Ddye_015752 [Dipteronia dyeriana]|uniref:Peptidyl-prolyl cis-trans isomerase n=1 Tax=Dipteronia dyeriana TaxID=168575 RepID=A0AAD9U665_9ROSI|nr:hypothetical protein Ddye_015752 [Dipteronia dyeriana]